jgi:hypothetical protein
MTLDAFRLEYKRFKAKTTPLDFADVIDFSLGQHTGEKLQRLQLDGADSSKASEFGLKSPDSWQIFQISTHPGNST